MKKYVLSVLVAAAFVSGCSQNSEPATGMTQAISESSVSVTESEAFSETMRENLEQYMAHRECACCHGRRLKPEVLAVTVGGKNIYDLTLLSVAESIDFFDKLQLSETQRQIARQIEKEIRDRLRFMKNVGLDYLTLERRAATLSGGEAQRIRLATQIGASLMGVLYILDEPSI